MALTSGCGNVIQSLRARDHINKGVNAFKNAAYPQAIDNFKEAVRLDPTLINARLYLATAYMSQYVPGAESEENQRNADAATKGFMDVLERDANNQLAIESLGSLCFNQKKLEEAKQWYLKLLEINNKKKEAFYTVGVINWTKSYQPRMEVRAKIGMKPEDPGPIKDKKAREELKTLNEPVVMTTLVKGWAACENGTTLAAHRSEAAKLATIAFIWHLRVHDSREIVGRRQARRRIM
jgi:tetratricopeptide (TPR) repeat protein